MASSAGAARGRRGTFPPRGQQVAPSGIDSRLLALGSGRGAASSDQKGPDVRLPAAISLFAASLMALTPFEASAQTIAQSRDPSVSVENRPRPEYDPLGMRVGAFDLNATLDLGVSSTDNLFAAEPAPPPPGEQSDVYYTISPSMRLASHWSRHALEIDAGLSQTEHSDFSDQSASTGYLTGIGRLDVGNDTQITGLAHYARQMIPRTSPDSLTGGKPDIYTLEEGSLSVQQAFNWLLLTGTADQTSYNYSGVLRDMTQNTYTGRVEAEVTPRIGLLGIASFDHRDYNHNPGLSSDGHQYLVGVAFHLTDLMLGEVDVGQFHRSYDDGEKVSGTAVNANLEWYVTRLTTVDFTARRNAEDSGAFTAQPYIDSAYGVHVDHELLRNVILSAGGEVGTRDYQAIDRTDDYSSAMVGARYILNRRVALTARYDYDRNKSTGADRYRDYTVNTVSVGVSLRL